MSITQPGDMLSIATLSVPNDALPIARAASVLGTYVAVVDVTERNQIPASSRKQGMLVRTNDGTYYVLGAGLTNADWAVASFGNTTTAPLTKVAFVDPDFVGVSTGSIAFPFATLAAAIASLSGVGVIVLAPGTYGEASVAIPFGSKLSISSLEPTSITPTITNQIVWTIDDNDELHITGINLPSGISIKDADTSTGAVTLRLDSLTCGAILNGNVGAAPHTHVITLTTTARSYTPTDNTTLSAVNVNGSFYCTNTILTGNVTCAGLFGEGTFLADGITVTSAADSVLRNSELGLGVTIALGGSGSILYVDETTNYFTVGGLTLTGTGANKVVYRSGNVLNRTYYVDGTSSGVGRNGSLEAPFTTIQAAITAATSRAFTACQIYVAAGVYTTPFTAPAGMAVSIEGLTSDNIDYYVGTAQPSAQTAVRLQGAITHANTAANSSLMFAKCSIEADITYTGTQAALLRLIASPIPANDIKNGNGGTGTAYNVVVTSLSLNIAMRGYDTRGYLYLDNVVIVPGAAKYDCGQIYANETNFGVGLVGTFPAFNTFADGSQFHGVCSFRNLVFNGAFRDYIWYFSLESARQFHRGSSITFTTVNGADGPHIHLMDPTNPQEYIFDGGGSSPVPSGSALAISFASVGSLFYGNWAVLVNANTVITFSDVPIFSQWVKIRFVQDATGGRTVQLPTMAWRGDRVGRIDRRPNAESVLWVLWNHVFRKWEDAHIAASTAITTPTPAAWDGTEYAASEVANDSSVTSGGASVTTALNSLQTQVSAIPAAPVTSVFGRTGAVLPVSGDYNSTKITNSSDLSGTTVTDALNGLISQYSSTRSTGGTTLQLADHKRLIRITGAATVTIPTNASVAFTYGTEIDLLTETTGAIVFAGAGGVTIRQPSTFTNTIQWAKYKLVYLGSDEWLLTQEAMAYHPLSIVDADVNAAAAISGTKISPDFGAQNIATTGYVKAPQFGDGSTSLAISYNSLGGGLRFKENGSDALTLGTGSLALYGTDFVFETGPANLNIAPASGSGTLGSLTVRAQSGNGSGTYKGGRLSLEAGAGVTGTGSGGDAVLQGGQGSATGLAGNVALAGFTSSWQSMSRGVFIPVAEAAPTGNPTSGFYLYVDPADNKLKVLGPSGTHTTLALP